MRAPPSSLAPSNQEAVCLREVFIVCESHTREGGAGRCYRMSSRRHAAVPSVVPAGMSVRVLLALQALCSASEQIEVCRDEYPY